MRIACNELPTAIGLAPENLDRLAGDRDRVSSSPWQVSFCAPDLVLRGILKSAEKIKMTQAATAAVGIRSPLVALVRTTSLVQSRLCRTRRPRFAEQSLP